MTHCAGVVGIQIDDRLHLLRELPIFRRGSQPTEGTERELDLIQRRGALFRFWSRGTRPELRDPVVSSRRSFPLRPSSRRSRCMPQAGAFPSRPRRWTSLLRSAAAFGALFGSACHIYVPLDEPTPALGASVRVSITPDAAQALAGAVGRPVLQNLDGRFVGTRGDSVLVSVLMDRDPRYAQQSLRQEFSVSRSDIIQLQGQVISRRRTTLFGVGVVGLLALLVSQYSSSGGDPGPQNGPDPNAPLFSIGIPISR